MTNTKLHRIKSIIECPDCHGEIQWLDTHVFCNKCRYDIPIESGVPIFYKPHIKNTADSKFQSEQMFDNTFTAKIYNKDRKLISSEFMPKNHLMEFLKKTKSSVLLSRLVLATEGLEKTL